MPYTELTPLVKAWQNISLRLISYSTVHISDLSVCVSFSGTIYAQSSRMFTVNGHMLPYAWNHSITYDPIYGRMPYLVQRLQATDLDVEFDVSREVLQYQMGASIAKGKSTITLKCLKNDHPSKVTTFCQSQTYFFVLVL